MKMAGGYSSRQGHGFSKRTSLKLFLLLFGTLSLTSCATILNGRATYVKLTVISPSPSVVVKDHDTIKATCEPVTVVTERSKKPLRLTVLNDSVSKNIFIKSRTSFAFWLNAYPGLWPGFIIDWKRPDRYAYPRRLYVD